MIIFAEKYIKMKQSHQLIGVILLMITASIVRWMPHMPNFTPLESLAIFGAAYLTKKQWAYLAPIVLMYVSDFVINNTISRSFFTNVEGIVWFSDYMIYNILALLLIVLVSRQLLKKVTGLSVFYSAVSACIIFYLVTNFGAWLSPLSIHSKELDGLAASYISGLPFLKISLIGTLFFSSFLFGTFTILQYFLVNQGQKSTAH